MAHTWQFSPQTRRERLIASLRVVLALSSLLAIWLDPSEPRYAGTTYTLLAAYATYSMFLTGLAWTAAEPVFYLQLFIHAFDLGLFCVFMFLTEGPISPFFVYFVFSMLAGTLRWQWRGALWTGIAALGLYVGLGVYAVRVLHDPVFRLSDFIIRSVYLAIVGGFLVYFGVYQQRFRRELDHLARWPRLVPAELPELMREILGHAAMTLAAPRVLMAWEEREEPWLHLVLYSEDDYQWRRESPLTFRPLVAERVASRAFLCSDASAKRPAVLYRSQGQPREWLGEPLNPELVAQFSIKKCMSVPVNSDYLQGWILVLDRANMTFDDLALATIVAREVVTSTDEYYVVQELRRVAVTEERTRLGRDLHDGILQTLTGIRLQLQTFATGLQDSHPQTRDRLVAVERVIGDEQRELRTLVQQLTWLSTEPVRMDLPTRLKELQERVQRHWGLVVRLSLNGGIDLSDGLVRQMYLMAHEAVVNAARHANASSVELSVKKDESGAVKLTVSDDGSGFPFRGRYDAEALKRIAQGPLTLRERAESLGGTLVLESTAAGSRIEITLPPLPAEASETGQ